MKMKNLKHIPAFTAAILLVFALSAGAAAQPVSVVRDLPFKAAVDSSFTVTLTMNVDENNTPISAGLTEFYPASFNVSNISYGGRLNATAGKIEWLFWPYGTPVSDKNITYTLKVPISAAGNYSFNGNIDSGSGSPAATGGDSRITIVPYGITVKRYLPSTSYTDSNITVYLYMDVSESQKPNAISLVEFFPPGWDVFNISNGGIKRNGSIEWLFSPLTSPVQDTNISYVLSVPGDANGTYGFSGQFNYSAGEYGPVSEAMSGDTATSVIDKCTLSGDIPPCGVVEISEVITAITSWASGDASITDVIAMINAWAKTL